MLKNNAITNRPTQFRQIKGQKIIIQSLLSSLKKQTLPDKMLFSGPPGSGKTTTATCLATAYFCESYDFLKRRTCGICQGCKSSKYITHVDCANLRIDKKSLRSLNMYMNNSIGKPIFAKYSVNIFEEVHNWQPNEQKKLLKILEDKAGSSLTIFTTSEITKLIIPFQSRLCLFNFSRLSDASLLQVLENECRRNAIQAMARSDLLALSRYVSGDGRKAVTILPLFAVARAHNPNAEVFEILRTF